VGKITIIVQHDGVQWVATAMDGGIWFGNGHGDTPEAAVSDLCCEIDIV
jgi:hypothetical protein